MRRISMLAYKFILLNLLTFCRNEIIKNLFPLSINNNSNNGSKSNGSMIINGTPSLSVGGNKCSKITSGCYECASNNGCFWCSKTKTCDNYESTSCSVDSIEYIKNSEDSDFWFLNFYYMCDPIDKCGKNAYDVLSGKINISVKDNLNIYDGCYWVIQNKDLKNYSYSLQRLGSGRDKVSFANFPSSTSYSYEFDYQINSSTKRNDENFFAKIIFYQYFDTPLHNLFKMEINLSTNEEGSSILRICAIVISSLISALICLFILRCILVHCCFRRSIGIDDSVDRLQPEIAQEINEANIEEIIDNFKESSKEECKKTGQNNCTVCLLPNEGKEKIISLPCHHYFHYNCITNWVRRKNIKPTCPNCNYDLLSNKKVPIPSGFLKNDKETKQNTSDSGNNKFVNTLDGQSRSHTDFGSSDEEKHNNVKVRDLPLDSTSNELRSDLNSSHNSLIVNVKKKPTSKK